MNSHSNQNVAFITEDNTITLDDFYADIAQHRSVIKKFSCQNVLLFDLDTYRFTVQLLALLLENKHVLLPPNGQLGTVEQLRDLFDSTMGTIAAENKPVIARISLNHDRLSDINDNKKIVNPDLALLFSELLGKVTFFTSGSTGTPKAIEKSPTQLLTEINILSATFNEQIQQSSCVVSTVSHQHIYGLLFKVLLPLKMGLTVVSQTFEYPEHIVTFFEKLLSQGRDINNKVLKALFISSPAHLKRLVEDNVLSDISNIFSATYSSGGPLSWQTSKSYKQQMQQAPIEVFGSTETGGIAWRCGQSELKSPWYLFPQLSYKTVGPTGLLTINSPYVMTSDYVTDDIIESIDSQSFYLLGRADRTIKLEEKRVNLAHVELCLSAHPWVSDCRILVVPLSDKNDRVVLAAVVELTENAYSQLNNHGKRAVNETLKQQLLTEFERISLPKKWRYLRAFPYNSQGKLAINEMERLFD